MDSFILDIGVSPSTRGKFFKKVSKILEKKTKNVKDIENFKFLKKVP